MSLPGLPPELDPVARLWAGIAVATTVVFTVYGPISLQRGWINTAPAIPCRCWWRNRAGASPPPPLTPCLTPRKS